MPRPGEVTLSHRGVVFLDKLPEFGRTVLEVLLGETPTPDPQGTLGDKGPDIDGLLAEVRRIQGLG